MTNDYSQDNLGKDSVEETQFNETVVQSTTKALGGEVDFVPTFSPRTRTIVYVSCMILGIVSYVLTVTTSAIEAPVWLTVACATCTAIPGYIAAAFGVHYDGVSIRNYGVSGPRQS